MNTPTRRRTASPAGPAWNAVAACAGVDPDLFFPEGAGAAAKAEDAKKICSRCPVLLACRRWALETRQDYGVLGGMTEDERRAAHGRRLASAYRRGAADHILTYRLAEFTELAGRGLRPSEIARELGTNVHTVKRVLERLSETTDTGAGTGVEGSEAA